jgi:putative transposase
MAKDTHSTLPSDAELVLAEQVTIALAELAGAAREGLLALAVGTGLGVLGSLLDADVERVLAKLSTRRYQHGLEPVGAAVEQAATGTSKSAVSRRFVAATEHALAELLTRKLSTLDLVALMVDGIKVADHTCVVALGITLDGTKVPLGLAEGATENATVVRDLLADLRERGLETTRPILCVIDGAKALGRAISDVFDHPMIQRCQLHKLRNVTDRLPDAVASTVAKRMRRASHHPDVLVAQAELEALAHELDRSHPGAAASLREGLTETLTIGRLGVPPTLARTLRSTNSQHQLPRVDDLDLPRPRRQRPSAGRTAPWCCAGSPPAWARQPRSFARVNGHLHLPALRAALDATVAVTPTRRMPPPDHLRAATEVPRRPGHPLEPCLCHVNQAR